MGLDRYGAVRIRFTWRNRSVNKSTPKTSQKVLADCKDQRGHGGKCTYFSFCTALEAHQRLKVDQPCAELSWEDLENKSRALDKGIYSMLRCLTVLKDTGVCYKDSEETLKIKDYEEINTRSAADINRAVKNYLKDGPMVGVFEVVGSAFDHYGEPKDKSNFFDDIYVVNQLQRGGKWTHAVTITGFGVQGKYPFWEFQNSYGPLWRGAARGFGQIYAVHLYLLYGFTLA